MGVIDSGQNPQDLLMVRKFSSTSSYNAGDYVIQNQQLYQANVPVTPGAFNATQWQSVPDVVIATAPPSAPSPGELWFDDVGQQLYIYYNDGTSAQWVPTTNQTPSGIYLPLAGGTVTGNLTVQGSTTLAAATGVTPSSNDNSTKLATTAFFAGQASTTSPAMDSTSVIGVSAFFARADHVHPSDTTKFNVAGGGFTGQIQMGTGSPVWSVTAAGAMTTTGFAQFNGGAQFYATAPTTANNTTGLVQLYDMIFRNDYWPGYLSNCMNSFSANPNYIWGLGTYSNWSGGGGLFSRVDTTNANLCGWLFGAGSMVGTIGTNGSSTMYNTGSDGRLKQNVRDMVDDIDVGEMIDAIRPVTFEWKDRHTLVGEDGIGRILFADDFGEAPRPKLTKGYRETRGTTTGHGFIAQELIKVAPFAVSAPDDGESPLTAKFGEPGYSPGWGIDFAKLVPYMIAEIQNLRKRVAELEGAR